MSKDGMNQVIVHVTLDDGDRSRRMLLWTIPQGFMRSSEYWQDALLANGWAIDGLKALKIVDVGKLHQEQGALITWLREENGFDVVFGPAL